MAKLEKAITIMTNGATAREQRVAPTAMLIVTIAYLVAVLSVPLYAPQILVWLAIYPIVTAEMTGEGYARILLKSLWVLPLVALIGIFNPIIERQTAFEIGGIAISRGWVSFVSIILRGMLAMQAVLLMISTTGFYGLCDTLRHLGCPAVLTTQMALTYRYMTVMMEEALAMRRAREARGYGRKSYPLKMWGIFVGQLLIRSFERAGRIHRAMIARGYNGKMPLSTARQPMTARSWTYTIIWILLITACRVLA